VIAYRRDRKVAQSVERVNSLGRSRVAANKRDTGVPTIQSTLATPPSESVRFGRGAELATADICELRNQLSKRTRLLTICAAFTVRPSRCRAVLNLGSRVGGRFGRARRVLLLDILMIFLRTRSRRRDRLIILAVMLRILAFD
jgi:hypothetical protein